MLQVSRASAPNGIDFLGARLWLDPAGLFDRELFVTDDGGFVDVEWTLLPASVGSTVYAQFLVRAAEGCVAPGQVVASNALEIVIQP
jgi:hypothetical protein